MKLQVGDCAPKIEGILQDGSEVHFEEFKGKPLLLFFYPKDNTKGCTDEVCSLRDGYEALQAKGITLLGVSPNGIKSHQGFIAKHGLPFSLVADTTHAVAEAYGTWVEKTRCGRTYMGMQRTTFLIGADGKIVHIFDKVKTASHADQVLEVVNKLGW